MKKTGHKQNVKKTGHKQNVKKTDEQGNTPLMRAVSAGDAKLIKCLVQQGADVNAVNNTFDTALLLALGSNDANILKILIEAGADVNYVQPFSRQTALHRALHFGSKENVKLLLESGADVNAGRQTFPGTLYGLLIENVNTKCRCERKGHIRLPTHHPCHPVGVPQSFIVIDSRRS